MRQFFSDPGTNGNHATVDQVFNDRFNTKIQ